ncbi:hypothetical protein [uncultured Chitinophaga sp.]|jgi:hypothetical protein|uniref:hypothetical protein n=1 Tax=uncultured Chitinophaga sp. TaxID=339340 RepID=UPI0026038D76|nr:hypothetical protein [uncultured Chitinophaga sp.]
MKKYTLLVLCILLFTACIKHPEQPPLHRPQWLINKVIRVTLSYGANPLPGSPVVSATKTLWEIEYNQHYKPYIRRIYQSGRNDTLNLVFQMADTLLYDAKLRVKEMRSAFETVIFTYSGNDTLPSRKEAQPAGYTLDYAYHGDTVIIMSNDPKFGHDTTRVVYPNGNLSYSLSQDYPTLPDVYYYDAYDNGPIIERSMNLSIGGLYNLPFTVGATPRLSRNNWTHSTFFYVDRVTTYNEYGLPIASYVQEYFPEEKHICRYEYFETRP